MRILSDGRGKDYTFLQNKLSTPMYFLWKAPKECAREREKKRREIERERQRRNGLSPSAKSQKNESAKFLNFLLMPDARWGMLPNAGCTLPHPMGWGRVSDI